MKAVPLLMLMAACGSAPAKPDATGGDLLVWSAEGAGETLWLRDGTVVAKAEGIFVATPERAWQVMLVPRKVMDQHLCSDGWDGEDRVAPEATETSVLVLVARPLDNGEPRELAAQLEGDTTMCGVPGAPPALVGGVGARVSAVWAEGRTTSAAIGEESSPEGAVFELGGERVELASPPGFEKLRADVLDAATTAPDDECPDARDGWGFSGPDALRVSLDEGAVSYAAAVSADTDGATCDHLGWVPVADALGLGAFPDAAVAAASAAWTSAAAIGVSWVPNDLKVRVQLERAFGL